MLPESGSESLWLRVRRQQGRYRAHQDRRLRCFEFECAVVSANSPLVVEPLLVIWHDFPLNILKHQFTTSSHTMNQAPLSSGITRLPYPQTVESARTFIVANGLNIAELARANGLARLALQDLLRPNGQLKGLRGQAHLAAIVLGLKPGPSTAAARDPAQLPRRKNAAMGAAV